MGAAQTVFTAVLPVFGIIAVGMVLRRLNWLTEEADHSLLRVNINLLFPCLILDKVVGNPALLSVSNVLLAPVVGFGTVAAGFAVCAAARRFHGLNDPRAARTFAVTAGLYNYSYVPLPLSLLLFGGSETAGVLFVHNVGVELAMWTLGVMIFTGTHPGRDWRKCLNAPLISIVAALALNAIHADQYAPKAVLACVRWLGDCAIPMSLILIGAVVCDHLKHFRSGGGWRVIGAAIFLRLLVLPVIFLLLAKYLPATVELKRVIVLEAAMPSAVFPIVMARHYGGDLPTALRVVIGTSVVGLLTIPLWIRLGMRFAGL